LGACDCQTVPNDRWKDLGIQCNGQSDFATSGSDQVVLDTEDAYVNFLKRDCMRGAGTITAPAVDFGRQVVVVDVTFSPLPDGTCIAARTVSQVRACTEGVDLLYHDTPDPECARRPLTGAVAVDRDDVRAAF
jgi:hypothetical protein